MGAGVLWGGSEGARHRNYPNDGVVGPEPGRLFNQWLPAAVSATNLPRPEIRREERRQLTGPRPTPNFTAAASAPFFIQS